MESVILVGEREKIVFFCPENFVFIRCLPLAISIPNFSLRKEIRTLEILEKFSGFDTVDCLKMDAFRNFCWRKFLIFQICRFSFMSLLFFPFHLFLIYIFFSDLFFYLYYSTHNYISFMFAFLGIICAVIHVIIFCLVNFFFFFWLEKLNCI